MVATAWGLLYFGEFTGCPLRTKLWVGGMFLSYLTAIACIAMSRG